MPGCGPGARCACTCSIASRVSLPLRPRRAVDLRLLEQPPLLLGARLARRPRSRPSAAHARARLPHSGASGGPGRGLGGGAKRGAALVNRSLASSTSPPLRRAAASASSPAPSASSTASGRERAELDRGAAREDRLGELLGLGADQDQVSEGRRLLERLQQRVLALVAQVLGLLDDEDARAPPSAGLRLAARITCSRTSSTRCWAPGGRSQTRSGWGEGSSRARRRASSRIGGAVGEQLGRERSRGGGLARAARAAEEVGVARRRASAAESARRPRAAGAGSPRRGPRGSPACRRRASTSDTVAPARALARMPCSASTAA